MQSTILKSLIKVANRLDTLGLTKESDYLDSIIVRIAGITKDDEDYMTASTRLAREIMNFILPSINELDAEWSKLKKVEDYREIQKRLIILGDKINKSTPSGVNASYKEGEIQIVFDSAVFTPESQALLTDKKSYPRPVFLFLTLNDTSEASGGGPSIDISVIDILEGGSSHNGEREFWPAMELFIQQLYHEITHLDRYGSSPTPSRRETDKDEKDAHYRGTINYLMNPGEVLAHAHQAAITYYNQFPNDAEITWDRLLSIRYPKETSRNTILNYHNLSLPDRIEKYQRLFNPSELDLSTVSARFLEVVNSYYRQIKATH
jgi:hypothetical protein